MNNNYSILGGTRAIQSLRSSGYSTTAHALAELIDNSVQAESKNVSIVVEVDNDLRNERSRESIRRISVVDDGHGMDPELIRNALKIGEGTHFDDDEGMGKFGVGLPQASISQGKLIEIWSWQDGKNNAYYVRIDLSDDDWITSGAIIPEAVINSIPKPLSELIEDNSVSGTIVRWSKLDRITWSSSNALYKNSEFLIGRMYRYWLSEGKLTIKMHVIDMTMGTKLYVKDYRAVDPLYLMSETSVIDTNPPVNPMFEGNPPVTMKIMHDGKEHEIIINSSVAKKITRKRVGNQEAGSMPYGKHAAKNVGLSIVREGRELELDPKWSATPSSIKDPRNRWWGAEICFKSGLDEVFGVTNNKQHASKLSEAYDKSFETEKEPGESAQDARDRIRADDPIWATNIEVAEMIREVIRNVFEKLPKEKDDSEESKSTRKNAEERATSETVKQVSKGLPDVGIERPEDLQMEKRVWLLEEDLKERGYNDEAIKEVRTGIIDEGLSYQFVKKKNTDSDAFFSVTPEIGALIIELNTAHPMYDELFGVFSLVENEREYHDEEVKEIVDSTYDSIKLLLGAWARMEDLDKTNPESKVKDIRKNWGKMMLDFRGK